MDGAMVAVENRATANSKSLVRDLVVVIAKVGDTTQELVPNQERDQRKMMQAQANKEIHKFLANKGQAKQIAVNMVIRNKGQAKQVVANQVQANKCQTNQTKQGVAYEELGNKEGAN